MIFWLKSWSDLLATSHSCYCSFSCMKWILLSSEKEHVFLHLYLKVVLKCINDLLCFLMQDMLILAKGSTVLHWWSLPEFYSMKQVVSYFVLPFFAIRLLSGFSTLWEKSLLWVLSHFEWVKIGMLFLWISLFTNFTIGNIQCITRDTLHCMTIHFHCMTFCMTARVYRSGSTTQVTEGQCGYFWKYALFRDYTVFILTPLFIVREPAMKLLLSRLEYSINATQLEHVFSNIHVWT